MLSSQLAAGCQYVGIIKYVWMYNVHVYGKNVHFSIKNYFIFCLNFFISFSLILVKVE